MTLSSKSKVKLISSFLNFNPLGRFFIDVTIGLEIMIFLAVFSVHSHKRLVRIQTRSD